MSVTMRATIGTVNFTDWLHITVRKVPAGSPVVWETWIDVPFTSYNLIVPGLDPDNYIVSFYDAATNTALGTLHLQLIVNALTNEWQFERRFYTCGGAGAGDPADSTHTIVDPYLVNRNVTGVFIESFRYLKDDEMTFDTATGTVDVTSGLIFYTGAVVAVEIKYSVGVIAASGNGLYTGIITVIEGTRNLLATDRNTLVRLKGTAAVQEINLPALGDISIDDGFYFDNTCGGLAIQPKILTNGGDRIYYNGFFAGSGQFAEFWVSKGEHLLIRKIDSDFWEIRTLYRGADVGSRMAMGLATQAGWIPEDGRLIDGDEYGRIYHYVKNILPSTHKVIDDTLEGGGWTPPVGKEGLFVIHSTSRKMRMPKTMELSERGLKNFTTYGADTDRVYDYPGGKQNQKMMKHRHHVVVPVVLSGGSGPNAVTSIVYHNDSGPGDFKYILFGQAVEPTTGRTGVPIDDDGATISNGKNIIDNVGVIYGRKI